MDVEFADSFGKSLKKLIRHQTWWYKTYEFFRYDIKNFIHNIWFFRKELWSYKWWDYRYQLEMFKRSIEGSYPNLEKHGIEVDSSRMKKVEKMKRACQLMENIIDGNFIEQAEKELGELILHDWEFEDVPDKPGYSQLIDNETEEERLHNKKIFDRSHEIEEEQWNELWDIIRGQDRKILKSEYQKLKEEGRDDEYESIHDGTDLRGWWD